jgi:hypothetical protein
MHVLDLILNLHGIYLKKIYTWGYGVFKYVFQKSFKLFLSSIGYKIMKHKFFKSRFQVLYQVNWTCIIVHHLTNLLFLTINGCTYNLMANVTPLCLPMANQLF